VTELPTIIQNLQELQLMHQLNLELLEQLGVFFEWILKNKAVIPDRKKFESLLHKTQALMKELYLSSTPRILQYRTLSDESKQPQKSDGEVTEPYISDYYEKADTVHPI
jgi:hypothetical protein